MSTPAHARLVFPALGLLLACAGDTRADTPLPPPAPHEVASPDGSHIAVSVPRTLTTTIYSVGEDRLRRPRWAMYGWFRSLHVHDDGEHVVTGPDGLNLLPLDVPDDAILLRFFRRGEQVAVVTLADLVPNRAALKRTASHWLWREGEGLDAAGRFVVVTADGVRHVFDPTTGKRVLPPR